MKKLLTFILALNFGLSFGQTTAIPDVNFEQRLINLGYDNVIDGNVQTANINTVDTLTVNGQNIADLTGIEGFTALTELKCSQNQLTSLDVSQNILLFHLVCASNQLTSLDVSQNINLGELGCEDNQLISLDIRNGQNSPIYTENDVELYDNPNLPCIDVDNVSWCTAEWTVAAGCIDPQQYFSNNCSGTGIQEHSTNKKLLRTIDILGRETKNQPLFYIYDDGTVEKRIVIE